MTYEGNNSCDVWRGIAGSAYEGITSVHIGDTLHITPSNALDRMLGTKEIAIPAIDPPPGNPKHICLYCELFGVVEKVVYVCVRGLS